MAESTPPSTTSRLSTASSPTTSKTTTPTLSTSSTTSFYQQHDIIEDNVQYNSHLVADVSILTCSNEWSSSLEFTMAFPTDKTITMSQSAIDQRA